MDSKLEELSTAVEGLQQDQARLRSEHIWLKRKTEPWARTLEWIIEGSEGMEKLIMDEVGTEDKAGWGKVKKDLGDTIAHDLAKHFGICFCFTTRFNAEVRTTNLQYALFTAMYHLC